MTSSLQSLVAAAPTGRTRPVLIDGDDYATRVVRQGAPIPWGEVAPLVGYVGQVAALLRPDAVWADLGRLYAAYTDGNDQLRQAMGARSRTGYALRTLLGDDDALEHARTVLSTIAQTQRRSLVLRVPSPARWLGRAHTVAGTPIELVDEDRADSASMYLAEWLGRLGGIPVALVVLDACAEDGDVPVGSPERLAAYTSLGNVAAHFDWTIAIFDETGVETAAGEPSVGVLTGDFWHGGADAPDTDVLLSRIPATATPERVLDQLALLA